jgi:16S rRNA (guanine1207-N2)-methyltransferase
LDAGTRLLLDVLHVRVTDRVLDVGCGCGVVGLFAQRRAIKGSVTWLDVDLLACESARATLAANGATGRVLQGDGIAAAAEHAPYTLIVSNPPFHSGHTVSSAVAEALIDEAYAALEPRGRLVLVASRFLPYEQAMVARFGAAATLAENAQYRVLSAEKVFQRKERGRPTRRQRQEMAEETIFEIV